MGEAVVVIGRIRKSAFGIMGVVERWCSTISQVENAMSKDAILDALDEAKEYISNAERNAEDECSTPYITDQIEWAMRELQKAMGAV